MPHLRIRGEYRRCDVYVVHSQLERFQNGIVRPSRNRVIEPVFQRPKVDRVIFSLGGVHGANGAPCLVSEVQQQTPGVFETSLIIALYVVQQLVPIDEVRVNDQLLQRHSCTTRA